MNITKTTLEKLKIPEQVQPGKTVQKRYYDNKLKGFGVRVTSGGSKAFFVEKKIRDTNKVKRITIARYPELTVEQARVEAQKLIGQMVTGNDPSNAAKKRAIREAQAKLLAEQKILQIKNITFGQAYKEYIADNINLKASTIKGYDAVIQHRISDWLVIPLCKITDAMVFERFRAITEISPAQANYAFRILRAVFYFAMRHYKDANNEPVFLNNPTVILKRKWNEIERRQTVIKPHQLKPWFKAVLGLSENSPLSKADMIRDYLLLLIFTGLRRTEAASIKWEHIDFEDRSLRITNTKNGKPHSLPIPDYLLQLLQKRRDDSLSILSPEGYVFPGSGARGHLVEPKKQIARVIDVSGVQFCIHDLRRSFATYAYTLELQELTIKRLLNHSTQKSVTDGYIVPDIEQLRKHMQKIEDYILTHVGLKEPSVVTLVSNNITAKSVDTVA